MMIITSMILQTQSEKVGGKTPLKSCVDVSIFVNVAQNVVYIC